MGWFYTIFLLLGQGGPLGWKSTQYGNNLRQVSHLIISLAKQFLDDKGHYNILINSLWCFLIYRTYGTLLVLVSWIGQGQKYAERAKTEGMFLFILIPFVGLKSLWSYSTPLESSGIWPLLLKCRSVMKPKWDEYIFKEREYMEEEVSMGRFLLES